MTEQEMRESDVPTPKSAEELSAYVASLVEQEHDYGTCVYAMSMAATAAFYYVAGRLGVTGFQASVADLDFLGRTRRMKDGFRIVNYGDLLYPPVLGDERTPIFEGVLKDDDNRKRFADKAAALLAEKGGVDAVREHWERLAVLQPLGVRP